MKINKVLGFCLFLGCAAGSGLVAPVAAETPAPVTARPYHTVQHIPFLLLKRMRSEQGRERYISQVLEPLRNHGKDRNALRREDIEKMEREAEMQQKRRLFSQALSFDLNFDGKVTKEEIARSLADAGDDRQRNNIEEQVKRIMVLDTDGDGVLTLPEMATPPQMPENQQMTELKSLLALDPDGDGVLTSKELYVLAETAFDLVDTDKDTWLSHRELDAVKIIMEKKAAQQKMQDKMRDSACRLPEAAAEADIILLAAYQGDVSSVRLGDEERTVTYAQTVGFAPELPRKQYLVLMSKNPLIWHLEHSPDTLAQVVVVGPLDRYTRKVQAGVAGVDAGKVSFVPVHCFPDAAAEMASTSPLLTKTRAHLGLYLSREPAFAQALQKYERATVGSDKRHVQERPLKNPLLPGFDARVWRDHIEHGREYLHVFDAATAAQIVSPVKAAPYPVYPMAFGLAQLVNDGVLVPVENDQDIKIIYDSRGREMTRLVNIEKVNAPEREVRTLKGYDYKIVKPLAAYPQDVSFFLNGKFILTKNGALPKGRIPFCVIEEDTNQPVEGARCPRAEAFR